MCPVRLFSQAFAFNAAAGVILLGFVASTAGCFTDKRPTEVMVTPVAGTMRAARPPDCPMPVLTMEPTVGYRQIAIVEAWADIDEDPAKVLPELKRQACATGAQALLIVGDRKQDIKTLLYGVTPNEQETKVTSQNRDPNQAAQYIRMMQHRPRIGEEGHTGYYIDAQAIEFAAGSNPATANEPVKP